MTGGSIARRGAAIVPIAEAYEQSEGAVARGLSRDSLFESSFIDPKTQAQISVSQMVLLSMTAIAQTDDHFLGLGRKSVPAGQLILLHRIMMGCGTVERALNSIVRFHGMGHPIAIGLATDGEETLLQIRCDDSFGSANGPAIEEMYLNTIFGGLCYFVGRRFPVNAVTLRNRDQPFDVLHWSMAAPAYLGRAAALRFPTSALSERRQGEPTDDICWAILAHRIALDGGGETAAPGAPVSIRRLRTIELCDELGISPATFRRRNQASGSSFRRFREETLVDASLDLLADETRSVSWIAAQLGYADVRSYRRFIKGATGLTPDQLRAEARLTALEDLEPKIMAAIKDISVRLSE
jgi:AraC-like DNA-binding protein